MTLPISVVVPHQKKRATFFQQFSLPSIQANSPTEILIEDDDGHPCAKRNAGLARSSQPYVFFCDDDVVLARDCLQRLLSALEADVEASWAYCDFQVARSYKKVSPSSAKESSFVSTIREIRPGTFSLELLRTRSVISTMSLWRATECPQWDESLRRLQDWDLYLTATDHGRRGTYVNDFLFRAFANDLGISATEDLEQADLFVRAKHRLARYSG